MLAAEAGRVKNECAVAAAAGARRRLPPVVTDSAPDGGIVR
jgi:hypothetical protein